MSINLCLKRNLKEYTYVKINNKQLVPKSTIGKLKFKQLNFINKNAIDINIAMKGGKYDIITASNLNMLFLMLKNDKKIIDKKSIII